MGTLPSKADVVIIGGGIIGTSIAYYLSKKGVKDVLLLEKTLLGAGTTAKCVGGIRTQFSTRINIEFSLLSRKIFDRFEEEFGVDPEFKPIGYLFLAVREPQWEILKANARLMEAFDLKATLLEPGEIQRRWPLLRVDDLVGGSYTEKDGYAGPYEVLRGFVVKARQLGAVLREGIEVVGIQTKKGRVQAVETSIGEKVLTPLVVNAAGPYAAHIADMVGLALPVRPLRRQLFFTDPIEGLPSQLPMVIDLEYGWYMRREGRGLLLAGPQDSESSFNEGVDFEGQEWTAVRSLHRVPILEQSSIARGWAGLYEISPDHHAIIGSFPELKGFICANGFSGHGFQHSPAAGILVAELIVDGKAKSLDIHPLRPQRFQEGDLVFEPLTAFRD
jgi:glycine/D-amino acid oxidase-like deaminating enzyme